MVDRISSDVPMDLPDTPQPPQSVTLSLPFEEHWTLHHVLLDRIDQEAEKPSRADPPPVEVFQAFETLDSGKTNFTIGQLEAIQTILAEYHHSSMWESDCSQLEQLLFHVAEQIERHQMAFPTD